MGGRAAESVGVRFGSRFECKPGNFGVRCMLRNRGADWVETMKRFCTARCAVRDHFHQCVSPAIAFLFLFCL